MEQIQNEGGPRNHTCEHVNFSLFGSNGNMLLSVLARLICNNMKIYYRSINYFY